MKKDVLRHLRINEKGVAIATAMSVVLILALLGAGLLLLSMREMNISLKSESSNQAFHVAEAGVEYAMNKISNGEILSDYPDTTITFGAGEFVVSIDREVDFGQTPPQATYFITSTGIVEDTQSTETSWLPSLINEIIPTAFAADNQKTLQVEMKQTKPFTEYVFFMDEKQDADNYNFTSYKKSGVPTVGDEVTGSVHANGNVDINGVDNGLGYDLSIYSVVDGYPIFNGLVSYVNGINVNGTIYDNDQAVPGPYFDPNPDEVTVTVFPESNDEMSLREYADKSLGIIDAFGGDVMVEINGNSLSINGGSPITLQNDNNIIVVENGDILLSSSNDLDGKLTLVSVDGNIEISSNVQYEDKDLDPTILTDPENEISDDMLGLIAEKDIIVPYLDSVPDNISIDAVMLAKTGSVWYVDWNNIKSGMSDLKGILTVNGSIIQKTDFDNSSGKGKHFGQIKKGFLKRYNYDKRLYYLEPPYFFKPNRSLYKITWK